MLTVLVIMMLAAVGYGLVIVYKHMTKKTSNHPARGEMGKLATAITTYRTEYGRLPLVGTGKTDLTIESSGEIIAILTGEKPHQLNSKSIPFYEFPPARKNGSGGVTQADGSIEVLDLWKQPYRILLDSDGDGQIASPRDGTPVRTSVLVYSAGPDRNYDTWKDNLASWE